jgi:heavy metal sensor kinase
MNFRSLQFRITKWFVGFLALALLCVWVGVYLSVQQFLVASQKRSLNNAVNNIESQFLSQYGTKGENWVADEMGDVYAGGADRYVRILHNGREIFSSHDMRNPQTPVSKIPLPSDEKTGLLHIDNGGGRLLELVDHYTSPDGHRFTVIVGASEVAAHRVLRSLAIILSIVCPLVLVVAALACFLMIKRPLRPVAVLTEQAENIGRKHLGDRLPVPNTRDELQRLATSLNQMIARLEDALQHNNRFSADASHELRTPLTIVRGELEQVIQQPDLSEATVDSIGSALEEIERMSQIVQSLMATAYLDTGGEQMECEPTDLGKLVGSTLDQMRLLAEAQNIVLVGDRLESALVDGNHTRLKQVIVNLVDNAVKYNRPNGRVSASVFTKNHAVILEVADNGIGIPESSLPFIFDRFYRADKTRTRTTGGIGIGLSLVKAICNAHGATIDVKSRQGEGTVFSISFPRYVSEATTSEMRSTKTASVATYATNGR